MENKEIFITRDRRDGSKYDILATFDKDKAIEAADQGRYHLTIRERRNTVTSIESYRVKVLDGETAREAYDRLLDTDELPSDPASYETYWDDIDKLLFVRSLIDGSADYDHPMTPEQAAKDLANFRLSGWGIADNLSAEELAELWNDMVNA